MSWKAAHEVSGHRCHAGELDFQADEAFLEAMVTFALSVPVADIWQDRAWARQQQRLLTAQFGPDEVAWVSRLSARSRATVRKQGYGKSPEAASCVQLPTTLTSAQPTVPLLMFPSLLCVRSGTGRWFCAAIQQCVGPTACLLFSQSTSLPHSDFAACTLLHTSLV